MQHIRCLTLVSAILVLIGPPASAAPLSVLGAKNPTMITRVNGPGMGGGGGGGFHGGGGGGFGGGVATGIAVGALLGGIASQSSGPAYGPPPQDYPPSPQYYPPPPQYGVPLPAPPPTYSAAPPPAPVADTPVSDPAPARQPSPSYTPPAQIMTTSAPQTLDATCEATPAPKPAPAPPPAPEAGHPVTYSWVVREPISTGSYDVDALHVLSFGLFGKEPVQTWSDPQPVVKSITQDSRLPPPPEATGGPPFLRQMYQRMDDDGVIRAKPGN